MSAPDLAQLAEAMPLARELGIEFQAASAEEVRARLAWRPELCTAGGILHGGTLMALADAAGAVLAFLNLPEGSGTTATIESKTNFFRPVAGGSAHARSTILHRGRTTIVVDTDVLDDEGRRVARTTQTQAILR